MRHPCQSGSRLTMVIIGGLTLSACDTIGSDFRSLKETFVQPTPAEAAAWAVDTTDAEKQRHGVVLLGTADFGGEKTYLELYRLYVKESNDPLVKSASMEALARHGSAEDAPLLANQLKDASVQVRLAAATGLQRLHNPAVAEALYATLLDDAERSDIRVEAAVALGQYPRDDVFQALVTALDAIELAINLAAMDSLRILTGQDFSIDRVRWIGWYQATPSAKRFEQESIYLYPTYKRTLGFWDKVTFWDPVRFERPGIPAGMATAGLRSTYEIDQFGNVGRGTK